MTTSVYSTILSVVRNKIEALNLADLTVKVRRVPLVSRKDPLPLAVISPEQETVEYEETEEEIILKYPVRVTLFFPGNQLLEAELPQLLDFREAIRTALFKTTLTGASTVIDCTIELNPPFDQTLWAAEYDASSIRFIYTSQELRESDE